MFQKNKLNLNNFIFCDLKMNVYYSYIYNVFFRAVKLQDDFDLVSRY